MPKKADKRTRVLKVDGPSSIFGENVFNMKTMRRYLPRKAYDALASTICQGKTLTADVADEVADAMKRWAIEKGASHYTHWFQPLTGATAEKHDSFLVPAADGGAISRFSGKNLILGESDASSLPSGGLRANFEARGYTAWDPTSPAFLKRSKAGATLCIPTVFCSYHGESLDKKTPLLRSIAALTAQVTRMAKMFDLKNNGKRPFVALGAEQEYFLIENRFYLLRQDLCQTGRTLFGVKPAKHQQLEDHYFGVIKSRVLDFMNELDKELWRLGVPAKTRHNEVCPGQFEIAPVFEEMNLAVDHNMLIMEVLREVASRHGLACLLHEKPFAGMNGSGKHNNWSIHGPDGKNWMSPGDNPRDNARFLTIICALIKAVDTHAALLRASVASAGNDLRLGSNEAPPSIISIFLGHQLTDVIMRLEQGSAPELSRAPMPNSAETKPEEKEIRIGATPLPPLPRDLTDRNRTSPFAFTGDKFEFRAVGASQSCAGSNVVLNTIVADALDDILSRLEADVAARKGFNESLQAILGGIVRNHKRVLFDGDSYSEEWREEAKARGLPNLTDTPSALATLVSEETIALFEKHNVLSSRELHSRHEIYARAYRQLMAIEASCALGMARTMITPSALRYQRELAETLNSVGKTGDRPTAETDKLLGEVCLHTENMLRAARKSEALIASGDPSKLLHAMNELRESVDKLEELLPDDLWPIPSYADMMLTL